MNIDENRKSHLKLTTIWIEVEGNLLRSKKSTTRIRLKQFFIAAIERSHVGVIHGTKNNLKILKIDGEIKY